MSLGLGVIGCGSVFAGPYRGMIESLRDKIHIDFAHLGSDAGYIGAAGWARREYWAARTAH